ncbi:MAG TPA: hypothetical protein VNA57_12090 [Acidimicrobiales bacterium]|nr:hypothetical protein [Acidimicrobiales bacterium]
MTTACREPKRPAPAPLRGPKVIDVRMRDFAFDYKGVIPGGRVVFRARNTGSEQHQLELVPLGEDYPPLDEQLRGGTRRIVLAVAGLPRRGPGKSGAFAADLVPGSRYGFVCFVEGEDGEVHALKGMSSEFRAGGGPPGPGPVATPPSAG